MLPTAGNATHAFKLGRYGACAGRNDLLAIGRMDGAVLITVKDDGGRAWARRRGCGATALHGTERLLNVACRASGQSRVHAHRGEQVGIGIAKDGRHRAAR